MPRHASTTRRTGYPGQRLPLFDAASTRAIRPGHVACNSAAVAGHLNSYHGGLPHVACVQQRDPAPRGSPKSPWSRRCTCCGAHLRLFFPFTEDGASWVWIPSGLALAALLLRGTDRWPGVALGALLVGGAHRLALAVGDGGRGLRDRRSAAGDRAAAAGAAPSTARCRTSAPSCGSSPASSLSAAVTAIVGAWNLIDALARGRRPLRRDVAHLLGRRRHGHAHRDADAARVGGLARPLPRPLAARRSLRRCWPRPSSSARWCSASRPGPCTSCCRWPTPASR